MKLPKLTAVCDLMEQRSWRSGTQTPIIWTTATLRLSHTPRAWPLTNKFSIADDFPSCLLPVAKLNNFRQGTVAAELVLARLSCEFFSVELRSSAFLNSCSATRVLTEIYVASNLLQRAAV